MTEWVKLSIFSSYGKRGEAGADCGLYGELKDEFAALIQEFDEDGADQRKLDTLTEALDALEDAYDMVNEVYKKDKP